MDALNPDLFALMEKVSGKGGTEVLSFIVEDDLGGFRKGDQYLKVPFYFQNILVLDENGKYVQLPDQVAYINIRKNQQILQFSTRVHYWFIRIQPVIC